MKSLYIIPQYNAKNPMSKRIYLNVRSPAAPGNLFLIGPSNKHKKAPTKNRNRPCPISPNIIPNKNGKETQAKTLGFTSL